MLCSEGCLCKYGFLLEIIGSGQKHPVKCEEIKLRNTLDLNVKVKTDESKIWPIMTVKCEDEMLKCDKQDFHGTTPNHDIAFLSFTQ